MSEDINITPITATPPRRRPGRPRIHPRPLVVEPIPRPFDFGFTARRPLVPLAAVIMFLNKTAREIMDLIENGKLRWAFDISSAKATHREVRVLRQSLFEFTGLYSRPHVPPALQQEMQQVIKLILPEGVTVSKKRKPGKDVEIHDLQVHTRLRRAVFRRLHFPAEPILRGTEIAQCFCCDSQHVSNLVRENSLQPVKLRLGLKASPLILRSSVVEFLEKRRLS